MTSRLLLARKIAEAMAARLVRPWGFRKWLNSSNGSIKLPENRLLGLLFGSDASLCSSSSVTCSPTCKQRALSTRGCSRLAASAKGYLDTRPTTRSWRHGNLSPSTSALASVRKFLSNFFAIFLKPSWFCSANRCSFSIWVNATAILFASSALASTSSALPPMVALLSWAMRTISLSSRSCTVKNWWTRSTLSSSSSMNILIAFSELLDSSSLIHPFKRS
mmetsp:Transcript_100725/g.307934  ORF Transcript_100725/g.307934 Transcript_100725/m.307934 type:complete len:220 (+) Transcript_100725:2008-2667(+)